MTDIDIYKNAIARIYNTNNVVIGAGFLISNQYLLTCAHVVTEALDLPPETVSKPSKLIQFDFPFINREEKLNAEVDFWLPYQSDPQKIGDIAGLKLHNKVIPDKVQPICLKTSYKSNHTFRIFGFPNQRTDGVWAYGTLKDTLPNGWGQMEGQEKGYRVQSGFSGAPIWDNEEKAVVGMAVAEDKNEQRRIAFFLPSQALFFAWTELSSLVNADPTCLDGKKSKMQLNLNESDKNYLIKEIVNKYLPKQDDLKNIFLMNKTIFGNNFYIQLENQYNNFETRIIYLVDELIDTGKLNKFLEIVRNKYPSFANKI
jgi:V8-like Glu-specific endopeptidase